MAKSKKKRGRPVEYTMPEQIPDTPENVAAALMRQPPRKPDEWKFMQEHKRKQEAERATPETEAE